MNDTLPKRINKVLKSMSRHTGFWYISHRRAAKMCAYTEYGNRESPAQFQNRIKPRIDVNVRHITRSTV